MVKLSLRGRGGLAPIDPAIFLRSSLTTTASPSLFFFMFFLPGLGPGSDINLCCLISFDLSMETTMGPAVGLPCFFFGLSAESVRDSLRLELLLFTGLQLSLQLSPWPVEEGSGGRFEAGGRREGRE